MPGGAAAAEEEELAVAAAAVKAEVPRGVHVPGAACLASALPIISI